MARSSKKYYYILAIAVCGVALLSIYFSNVIFLPEPSESVVVYTALDREFSEPVFREFTRQTGITVRSKFDTESTKTVGLTQALFAERSRPRCDVFWNNEIVNTLRLRDAELLAAYPSPRAKSFPRQFRASDDTWHGFAARARVLIVNTELMAEEDRPDSILDLVDRRWQGKVGVAKPLAGTTATHAACLFDEWGTERAQQFFREVKQNARVMAGNKQVALAVARGELLFGITDTDDAMIELESGWPVTLVYPDQGEERLGTLFIPNTVCMIRGAPNEENARKLIDFLLSPRVERMLAEGPSAQIPLNPDVEQPARVETPETVRAMEVDFEAAAEVWDTAAQFLREEFATAN